MPLAQQLQDLADALAGLDRTIAGREIERQTFMALAEKTETELAALRDERTYFGRAVEIFRAISDETDVQFVVSVGSLVQQGLRSVFGDHISFTIERSSYGKQPTMVFLLQSNNDHPQELIDAHGGGMVALVGVILRIVVVRLMAGTQRQTLFLDEPLAMLSAAYRGKAAQLLYDLAHDLGLQIVMVTHHNEYSEFADTTITLERHNDEAIVGRSDQSVRAGLGKAAPATALGTAVLE